MAQLFTFFLSSRPVSHLRLLGFFSCGVARSSSLSLSFCLYSALWWVSWCPAVQNARLNVGKKSKDKPKDKRKALANRKYKGKTASAPTPPTSPQDLPPAPPSRSPSGSSLSLPHPHSSGCFGLLYHATLFQSAPLQPFCNLAFAFLFSSEDKS